jgi:hypothetical protein
MKISGLPGGKTMVSLFDPDEIEKVRFTHRGYRFISMIELCTRGLNVLICLGIQK